MRAYVPSYQIVSPASLGEALDALAQDNGTWKPFAGGTDLMVLLEAGNCRIRTTSISGISKSCAESKSAMIS